MTTDQAITEALAEDAAGREVLRWQLKGFIPGVDGVSEAVFKPWVVQASDYDELRQQLADVTNERDALRAALGGMLFEFDDGVGEDWSAPLLDAARMLCDAIEFKPADEVKS